MKASGCLQTGPIPTSIVAGVGFGGSFFGAARSVLPIAAAHERAGLLSAFYIESYLAFSLPSILVGLAAPTLGMVLSTYIYSGAVILLAVVLWWRRLHRCLMTWPSKNGICPIADAILRLPQSGHLSTATSLCAGAFLREEPRP